MALFEIDPNQFNELHTAIRDLSDNIGKWQAQQTTAIQSGFASLIATLTGADVAEVQKQIDQHALSINAVKERLQSSIDRNQTEGE